jgi:hypothetical protein
MIRIAGAARTTVAANQRPSTAAANLIAGSFPAAQRVLDGRALDPLSQDHEDACKA